MTRRHDVERAAAMVALGLDGWKYLTTTDPTEHLMLDALAELVDGFREVERQLLALEVVNTLARAVKR